MKFQIPSKAFLQQVNAVSKVITGKSSLSILENFLLNVSGETLTITGSDQENTMKAVIDITEPEGEGSVAVPAKRLLDILKEMPDQGLTIFVNDTTYEIDIKFLNGHIKFMGLNPEEYPLKEETGEDCAVVTVPASVICTGIDTTAFAVSSDTIRPVMTGICWDIFEDHINFVASDTHKLVKYENSSVHPGVQRRFILSSKPAAILKNLLTKESGDVVMTIDDKSALFKFDNFELSCRFIKGAYPDYDRVIPTTNAYVLTVDRQSLLGAMRRVGMLANMSSSLVRINVQDTELLLSSQDVDYSTSADEKVPCSYTGSPMTIGFQANHMVDMLANFPADSIVCRLADPAHAGIFVPETENENEKLLMLLMPMQVLDY